MVAFDGRIDIEQERQADYRTFNVAGAHRAIGLHLGAVTPLRVIPRHGPHEPDPDYAWACLKAIRHFHQGIEAEYSGFAEAQGVRFDALLPHISLNVTNGQVGQCSTLGYRTASGEIVVGRNYDFRYRQQLRYLIHTAPPGYAAHVGTNSGLVAGRYDGVNEYGVFASLHTVMADRPDSVQAGVPFHLVIRVVLETCSTAREAMHVIRHMPLFHSFNYFVADREEMYLLETYPMQVQVTGGRASTLAATNHYQHPDLQPLHGKRTLQHSRQRLVHLRQEAARCRDATDPFAAIQEVMRDHTASICGHQDGAATLWSVACVPAEQRLAYALGAPCRNPYQDVPWPGQGWGTEPAPQARASHAAEETTDGHS